ncbi:MAG: hypothetical protein ABI200_06135 [Gaiellales bacterium]
MKRHLISTLVILTAAAMCMLVSSGAAQARTVKAQGISMKAPAGYTLKWRNGSYTLSNHRRYVKVTYGRTPLALRPSASQIARGMKGRLTRVKTAKNGRTLTATITRTVKSGGKRTRSVYQLRLTRKGGTTTVQLYGRKAAKSSTKRTARRTVAARATSIFGPIVTAGDVRALNGILQTRKGRPRVIPFNLRIPTKVFQAQVQDGASARVPDLPGWQYNGTNTGYLTGGNINQGSFELGGFLMVMLPQFAQPGNISGSFTSLEAAIADQLPQHFRQSSGGASQVTVTAVQPVQGTAGWLGPNITSGMFQVAFTLNGRPWQGLFTVGAGDTVPGMSWGLYFSYVAVPVNGPGGIMPALMNTWATWNNDAAVETGLERAMDTIRTTRVPEAAIDPEVFDYTNKLWTDYIRG